jgi:hypothetical protein
VCHQQPDASGVARSEVARVVELVGVDLRGGAVGREPVAALADVGDDQSAPSLPLTISSGPVSSSPDALFGTGYSVFLPAGRDAPDLACLALGEPQRAVWSRNDVPQTAIGRGHVEHAHVDRASLCGQGKQERNRRERSDERAPTPQ